MMLLAALMLLLAPPPAETLEPGVTVRVYQLSGEIKALPRLAASQTPNSDTLHPALDLSRDDFGGLAAPFVTQAVGWLLVERAGEYAFRLTSDDGSRLSLDGFAVLDHDGRHGATAKECPAIGLEAGLHELRVDHFDSGGNRRLLLEWRPPGATAFTAIPTSALRAERDAARVTSPGVKRLEHAFRPGDRSPVEGVHPGWKVATIRPEGFEPMVGAMCFDHRGRLIVGTFNPLQRDEVALPDIESKEPDVLWALTGVTGDPAGIKVTKAAEGFYEPCGLVRVGEDLYVSHRREITKLSDRDGDGFYETRTTVASGWEGWNYHQFTFGLAHDRGRLFATLSTAMAPPAWEGQGTNAAPNGPMRGGVLEVDLSSNDARVIAGGTRTPNGIGLGPEGTLWYLDNQGTWMPTNQLAQVIAGRFYGHYNRTNLVPKLAERFPDGGVASALADRPRTPAGVLLPYGEVSNSPTQPQMVMSGPFAGQMLVGELTAGGVRRVFLEKVNGQWQGAVFQFTQGLECGVNRMVWGPDGALYVGGIGAGGNWNWQNTRFGLQRLSPSGAAAFEMLAVRAVHDGFDIEFTKPVDRAWLANPAHFFASDWTYEPTAKYGGDKVGVRPLKVTAATPSADGRTVRLNIAGLKPGRCVELRTDPVSTDGDTIWSTQAWYTLNFIPQANPPARATLAGIAIDPSTHGVGLGVLPPDGAVSLIDKSHLAHMSFAGKDPAKANPLTQDDLIAATGELAVGRGSGDLESLTMFKDALHIEWFSPPGGEGQRAGNSGVYMHGLYEVQVLATPAGDTPPAINQAGAIYNHKPADVNASTGPGTWQAYDIFFRAPRLENDRKTKDARVTVYWNGVLIHNDVAIPKPTGVAGLLPEPGIGKLKLQDHESDAQGPVQYRNAWIMPLDPPPAAPGAWIKPLEAKAGADGLPEGWFARGGAAAFRVESGELIGESRPNTPNTFAVWSTPVRDFELIVEFNQHPELNSGIQFRSEVTGESRDARVRGYQAELDPGTRAWTGGIYDEGRRGWLHPLATNPAARASYRKGEWNTLRILAQGPVVRTWINGMPAAEMFDAMTESGLIALQVHGVGDRKDPLQVRFRNLRVRELKP